MQFKRGVDRSGAVPALWWYLPVAERLHFALAGRELVVTSVRRPWGSAAHNPPAGELVRAADLRRWYLDSTGPQIARVFVDVLRIKLSKDCTVLLEPEDLTARELEERGGVEAVDPHIHLEIERESFVTIWF